MVCSYFLELCKGNEGTGQRARLFFQTLLEGLAERSGYAEVASVPWLPIGESGHLLMVCGLIDQRPERCIAEICVKNPHYPKNRTVPLLWTFGTGQEWGQKENDIRTEWANVTGSYLQWTKGRAQSDWPLSIVIEPGTGHFACTDEMVGYFAKYISAAVQARLSSDGSLRAVDLYSGSLTHLPLPGIEDLRVIPAEGATEPDAARAWYFNEDLALSAQEFAKTNWQAKTQMVAFSPRSNVQVNSFGFNSVTEISVVTDGEFAIDPIHLKAIPEGFVGAGEPISIPSGPPTLEWICGPFQSTGNGTFRIALDRTWKTGAASYLIARHEGDDAIRRSVQPAMLRLHENKEGAAQNITFEPIKPLAPDSKPVPLRAYSDARTPVYFTVLLGPAIIRDGMLELSKIPPKTRMPVEIMVAAWSWGRASEPKVKTSGFVTQTVSVSN